MVTSNCEYCGIEKEYIYKSAIKRFCNYNCSAKWKWENTRQKAEEKIIICKYCKKEFKKTLSFLKVHPNTKFCSKKCSSIESRTRVKVNCKNCGKEFETTRNKYCSVKCVNESRKKEYKKWEDKDFIAKYNKKYVDNNREHINLKKREYCKTEKGKAIKVSLRMKRRKAGSLFFNDIIEIKKRSKNKCYWCSNKVQDKDIHLDHYMPIALGGTSDKNNIVVSCRKCNQSKGSKNPIDYANKIGKLL